MWLTQKRYLNLPGDAQNLTQSAPGALSSSHLGPCTGNVRTDHVIGGAPTDDTDEVR